jgi:hypothetical protein
MTDATDALARLREPFHPNQISKLPKPLKKDAPKGKCNECGGWHGLPAVHLDYVGHAALTDRLLDVDPRWTWEPVGFGADGLPAMDAAGGMWIRLTVAGVTRLGYGSADGKRGGDAVKEIIGDALRNAAMRFGAALDLWHKGDLHAVIDHADDQGDAPSRDTQPQQRQRERSSQADPSDEMTAWAERQIAKFETFKKPDDFTALSEVAGHANYKAAKDKIARADKKLWDRLHAAEGAAFQRTDDVPF